MNTYTNITEVATAEKKAVVRDTGTINEAVLVTLAEAGMVFAEDAEARCDSSGPATFAT
ncbi:hypothetical protein RBB79_05435 [Tunturiibacter empetritectus]|uniref:Uncharacterized protein n=1 Tax=Tunturiibacter lichenicola TaxID=2051959 RepID=A0A852VBY4_9BACT|nr:hypothetical protein [Edaphobacter lichenicola]NYF88967.1 hypothetical protein [Edaphobacter lichenicola]